MAAEKTGWRRRLRTIITGIMVLAVMTGLAAEWWVIPAVIREQVENNLPDYWQGRAEIGEIDFSFFRPVVIREVSLIDEKKQRWLYADSITFKLDGWPGLHPVLTQIDVERPNVQLYFSEGKCRLPFGKGGDESSDNSNSYVDLRNINVSNIQFAVCNNHGLKKVWKGLQLGAVRDGPVYKVRLTRVAEDDSINLLFGGNIDPETLEAKLALEVTCVVEREEAAPLLSLLDVSYLREAQGRLMASLVVNGRLDDPANLKCQGTINLDNWNAGLFHNLEISNLSTLATINDRRIDFQNITANSCGGVVNGTFWVKIPSNQNVQYGGDMQADHIDLKELTEGITDLPRINKGTAMAHYTFDMAGENMSALRAYGLLMLDNAQLWNMPVVLQIFNHFNINGRDPLSASDLAALFAMNGATTTFHRAVLTNAISAVEMEPGGSVNLETGHVDMYVIGVPLKLLRKLISAIPLVKLIVPLRDRFSRLHLKGSWNDSASALIFKAPFKQLQKDTDNFMKSTAKAGGQVTEDTFNVFKNMFDDLAKKKTTQPARP
jgi:hypothetical protein